MSENETFEGFAYGEDVDHTSERSLGFRLLAPTESRSWCPEVEALARRLQAAPYPDGWPAADLFCSLLLPGSRRLIAVARYGLADHTSARRPGGIELVGTVGPAEVDVSTALTVYRWLRRRATAADDLRTLGGTYRLRDIATEAPPAERRTGTSPVLPLRHGDGGALLFAASWPGEPDASLGLLERQASASWQWLPLVAPDFPLTFHAERGPLVAWTPHLAPAAVRIDPRPPSPPPPVPQRSPVLWGLLLGLLVANLGGLVWLHRAIGVGTATPASTATPMQTVAQQPRDNTGELREDVGREQFAAALYDALLERAGARELEAHGPALTRRYEEMVAAHPGLRVRDANTKGKTAIGMLGQLAGRSGPRLEEVVRQALAKKGYDPELIQAACDRLRERLAAEVKEGR